MAALPAPPSSYISQSAVSYQIKKLESQLATPLFIRESGQGPRLTPAGEQLADCCRELFSRELQKGKVQELLPQHFSFYIEHYLAYPKVAIGSHGILCLKDTLIHHLRDARYSTSFTLDFPGKE